MRQVRRNVFETNSSSTHCLTVRKDKLDLPVDESIFLKTYKLIVGEPNSDSHRNYTGDNNEYIEVETKLNYLYNLLVMMPEDRLNEETSAGKLLKLLVNLFPNTDFSKLYDYDFYDYTLEDGDCGFIDDWYDYDYTDSKRVKTLRPSDITPFLDENNLKHFFEYGRAYFGNRDDEYFEEDMIDKYNDPDLLSAEWAG